MSTKISTLGSELASISRLDKNSSTINTLSQQLSSGLVSSSLTDYSGTQAHQLVNLNSQLQSQDNYQDVCKLVSTRITTYDSALSGMETIASNASSLANTNQSYDSETNASTAAQIKGYLSQVQYYLNTKSGDRYIFAGSRYTLADTPSGSTLSLVNDLPTLATSDPTSVSIITDESSLPDYDYDAGAGAVVTAQGYTKDTIQVDSSESLQYGITSNDPAFQELILGLRYAYYATQDTTNYTSLMTTAQSYINQGLSDIQAVHSTLSSNSTMLSNVQSKLTNDISDIKDQMSDIQSVDTNEVSVKLTSLQTTIEASYSATSILSQLSILKYL